MKNLYVDSVTMQNFLSFGNDPVVFEFKTGINLLMGKNGHGKSNVLQSVPFSLYGKTPRRMPKQHYVNDINRARCKTVINFHDDDNRYEVTRMVRPDGLEIRMDDQLIDSQKVREYQKFLENQMLGEISLGLFTNLIHISINKTQPFLALTKWQKREFIESLFSFSVYSDLYKYSIEKEKPYKKARDKANSAITSLQKLIKDKEDTIKQLESLADTQNQASDDRRTKLKEELVHKQKAIKDEEAYRDLLEDKELQIEEIKKALRKHRDNNIKFQHDIDYTTRNLEKRIAKLKEVQKGKKCSECNQDIPAKMLEKQEKKITKEIEGLEKKLANLNKELVPYEAIQLKEEDKDKLVRDTIELEKNLSLITNHKEAIRNLEKELAELEAHSQEGDIVSIIKGHKEDVEEYKTKIADIEKKSDVYRQYLKYLAVIKDSLKDEEIKRWALQKIRPFVNKKINEYLEETASDYRIIFDEEFEPRFSSRGHYESFSEGEKKKLDLALIFSFRDLLFQQKGVYCDILFIDEFLDSSLDAEAIKIVLDLIKVKQQKDNLKVYITSHNMNLTSDLFTRIYNIEKKIFSNITGGENG